MWPLVAAGEAGGPFSAGQAQLKLGRVVPIITWGALSKFGRLKNKRGVLDRKNSEDNRKKR